MYESRCCLASQAPKHIPFSVHRPSSFFLFTFSLHRSTLCHQLQSSVVSMQLQAGRRPPGSKKPGLDVADMANYRPIANLSYMSKVVERAAASRLTTNNLQPCFQSAYRKKHSTETAMLRVWSDTLAAADQRQVTLLGLLDMSAVFDCVDHDLLLQRLHYSFGMTGVVLD